MEDMDIHDDSAYSEDTHTDPYSSDNDHPEDSESSYSGSDDHSPLTEEHSPSSNPGPVSEHVETSESHGGSDSTIPHASEQAPAHTETPAQETKKHSAYNSPFTGHTSGKCTICGCTHFRPSSDPKYCLCGHHDYKHEWV